MNTFVQNIRPNTPDTPIVTVRNGDTDAILLAATYRSLIRNSTLSQEDLEALGSPRLRELLKVARGGAAAAHTSGAHADEFAGYSVSNPTLRHFMDAMNTTDTVSLAQEVQNLFRGASAVQIAELGAERLKALKAHFTQE